MRALWGWGARDERAGAAAAGGATGVLRAVRGWCGGRA